EAPAEEFSGSATIEVTDDSLVSISSLNFSVTAEEINSGKGGMDKRIDDALKINKHPKINFELSEITEMRNGVLSAIGTLNVAGVTKEVQMEVNYQILPDGSIQFEGTHTIDMTNHEVDPPTAMFGTIKAGAKVDIKFSTKYTL
ncbi:MAG: YceI family protein, partial [Gracilimonas sp.]|nr:YceI family protein [Gracilimonas sp.]